MIGFDPEKRVCLANDTLAASASFGMCLCMRSLLDSSSYCLIRLCNDVRASIVTGVTRVIDVCRSWFCGQDTTSSAFGTVSSAGGFGVFRSTLSGSSGNKPVAAHPAMMFLLVIVLSLAALYREVECSLSTVSKPPRYSRSTSSR